MKRKYSVATNIKIGFPADLDLGRTDQNQLLSWIWKKYERYSESYFCRNLVRARERRISPEGYTPLPWSTKEMRQLIANEVEALFEEETIADKYATMPDSVVEHFCARVASYHNAKRKYIIRKVLNGYETAELGPHVFLIGYNPQRHVTIKQIYQGWIELITSEEWTRDCKSVGEFWRYGRIHGKSKAGNFRVEIWYDTRSFAKRLELARQDEPW